MNKRQKQVQKQFLDNETQTLDELKKVYNQALESINKNIEDLMARADADTATVVYQLEYQKALKTQINGILDDMNSKQFTTVADYLNQSYEDGFIGTMYDLHGQGVPLLLPIDQEQVVQAVQLDSKISDGLYTAMGENVSKLKKDISSQVSRGIATGMSYQQVAQQISMRMVGTKYKTGGALARSMTIARTEGHRIQCQAGMDALHKAKDKGADVVKQWDSTLDGRTRESHRAVDREIKELNEKFSNGLMFPGDPSGPAAEVCNCRCALLQRARSTLKTPFSKWDSQNRELIDFSGEEEYQKFKKKYYEEIDKYDKRHYTDSKADVEQFGRYKDTLGSLAPKDFKAFKELKYKDKPKYETLKKQYRIVNQYKVDSGSLTAKQILDLDNRVISEKRTQFTSNFKKSGNIAGAYIDGKKDKMCFAHSNISKSSKGYKGESELVLLKDERRFKYIDVKKSDGSMRSNTFEDTEAKLFEHFADLYEKKPFKSITMLSERGMCDSCKGVMEQFKQLHPDVTINVVSNKKVEGNVWKYRMRKKQ